MSSDPEKSHGTLPLADGPIVRQEGGVLLVVEGPDAGTNITVEQDVLIGTAPDCDLTLRDDAVSRRHLRARPEPAYLVLSDQGSTNGSYVGEARFDSIRVRFGAEVRIGCSVLRYVPREANVTVEPGESSAFGSLHGKSEQMRRVFRLLEDVAPHDTTVLVEGETGTGKELVAEELHKNSPRAEGPFVIFDCGATPGELIASALLGHVKGAFTGAVGDRRGAMLEAHKGTLCLDEIGELPLELQPLLLRAIDKKAVCRLGSSVYEKSDVRIIAATNRDLRQEVAHGRFREDLYFRLAVIRLRLPALRERPGDIELLSRHFAHDMAQNGAKFADRDLLPLLQHRWPGNVRELHNVIERAWVLGKGERFAFVEAMRNLASAPEPGDLPFKIAKRRFVQGYLERLLLRHRNNISAAAREAGIDRKYLRDLLSRYGARTLEKSEPNGGS